MKYRPILFSAPMVRAILAGEKTQTRRVVKPQPVFIADPHVPFKTPDADPKGLIPCPYGKPGDQLWVKETYRASRFYDKLAPRDIPITEIRYESDGSEKIFVPWGGCDGPGRIRQSIFMRKWMSRITLEITDIRVERLWDISDEDAEAEGVGCKNYVYPYEAFAELWKSINVPGSWENNPWVWVVEFRKI